MNLEYREGEGRGNKMGFSLGFRLLSSFTITWNSLRKLVGNEGYMRGLWLGIAVKKLTNFSQVLTISVDNEISEVRGELSIQ